MFDQQPVPDSRRSCQQHGNDRTEYSRQTAFKESKLGQAQAKAVVFLIVVVVIPVTQLILSRRKEVEM